MNGRKGQASMAAVIDSKKTKLSFVPISAVKMRDGFWKKRMDNNHEKGLPRLLKELKDHEVIENFKLVSGRKTGERKGPYFSDSDLYKWMEGAAWDLQTYNDPKRKAELDEVIDEVVAAQGADGYINTFFQGDLAKERFTKLPSHHELYCAGHLFQAGVAHYRTTGDDKLLNACIRFADYMCEQFGPGKIEQTDGHPEIELALVELYRTTGHKRYLDLAGFFMGVLKFPDMPELRGHAVRAMYTCCGGADYYAETGDAVYKEAGERLWRDLTSAKLYITGGVGNRYQSEAIGMAYELPTMHAYSETCAAIGNAMWQYRMLAIYADAKFADEMERAFYNGVISGVSLSGEEYFYMNPLASKGEYARKAWFGCTCCPTNMVRTLATIPGYMYSVSDDGIWVHMFDNSVVDYKLPDGTAFTLEQKTEYPWNGTVELKIGLREPKRFKLNVRIPGWCGKATLDVNGEDAGSVTPGTYAAIDRTWHDGDTVTLKLDMPVVLMEADPRLRDVYGSVAVMRGPMVYCAETPDNREASPLELSLTSDEFQESRIDQLEGVVALKGRALAADPSEIGEVLYKKAKQGGVKSTSVTLVPYYAWCNRGASQMTVWMPKALATRE